MTYRVNGFIIHSNFLVVKSCSYQSFNFKFLFLQSRPPLIYWLPNIQVGIITLKNLIFTPSPPESAAIKKHFAFSAWTGSKLDFWLYLWGYFNCSTEGEVNSRSPLFSMTSQKAQIVALTRLCLSSLGDWHSSFELDLVKNTRNFENKCWFVKN